MGRAQPLKPTHPAVGLTLTLNYSRLGSPYLCGLACSALALYCAAFFRTASWKTAALSGALAGMGALFWAPYLFSIPGVLLARPILNVYGDRKRIDLRFALVLGASAALILALFYALAAGFLHITSWGALLAWVHESSPDSRDRKLLRMVNGAARGFYEMGDDAVWLKWFLFRDPYAHVTIWDVVRVSFAKIALFWGCLAGLVALLGTRGAGKRILLMIAVFTLPHLGLAAAYESGSVERYAPFLPALFLGFGYAMGSASFAPSRRILAAVLCCVHVVPNLVAGETRDVSQMLQQETSRLSLMTSLPPADRLFTLSGRDNLFRLGYGDPLNPLHRKPLPSVHSIEPMGPRVPYWQGDFACDVLDVWDRKGDAWITLRVLAAQPVRNWMWVDGDNHLTWAAIHQFFTGFESSDRSGGIDGFFRLRNTTWNRQLLLANIPGQDRENCLAPQAAAQARNPRDYRSSLALAR